MIYEVKINGYKYFADSNKQAIGNNPHEIVYNFEHLTENECKQVFDGIKHSPIIYNEDNYR